MPSCRSSSVTELLYRSHPGYSVLFRTNLYPRRSVSQAGCDRCAGCTVEAAAPPGKQSPGPASVIACLLPAQLNVFT